MVCHMESGMTRSFLFSCCALLCLQLSLSVSRADDSDLETVRKAAERGDAEAQIALAKAYFNGNGAPKDENQAFEWVRKAAEQGHPKAQYDLGVFYNRGLGVQRDTAEAVKWYRKS